MQQTRVLIADDHPVVREGLSVMIGAQSDMLVVGEAGSGDEAVGLIPQRKPDVLLLDLVMPGSNAHDTIERVRNNYPGVRVIVLTSFHGDEDIFRALEAGARGYLLKEMSKKELLEAIRSVMLGKRVMHPDIAACLADRIGRPNLTPRELDVLKLIAEGTSNKEIADALTITEGTVKGYVNAILCKMGVRDRTKAATEAIRRGILRSNSAR